MINSHDNSPQCLGHPFQIDWTACGDQTADFREREVARTHLDDGDREPVEPKVVLGPEQRPRRAEVLRKAGGEDGPTEGGGRVDPSTSG